jgi:hypothetical protein
MTRAAAPSTASVDNPVHTLRAEAPSAWQHTGFLVLPQFEAVA